MKIRFNEPEKHQKHAGHGFCRSSVWKTPKQLAIPHTMAECCHYMAAHGEIKDKIYPLLVLVIVWGKIFHIDPFCLTCSTPEFTIYSPFLIL